MALQGWSIQKTATRFVIYPNTLRAWKKSAAGGDRAEQLPSLALGTSSTTESVAGEFEPSIQIERQNLRGDPRLPVMGIHVKLYRRGA